MSSIRTRWEADPHLKIQLAWEALPSPSGHMHAVDPDPDAQFENYPVSLCGTALVARGGKADSTEMCPTCQELMHERQAEFDLEVQEGRL